MAQDLYLLKDYSNYFNRKIRRKETLNAYLGAVSDNFLLTSINFSLGDGITASHTIGSSSNPYDNDWQPDYVLLVDHDSSAILSRWYVVEFTKAMGYQYLMKLKRDVVADYYENIIYAPCYIEKGHLEEDDPMIVNNEGISFNQIKTKEYYLKDETKVPWIVCYLNQYKRPWTQIKSKFYSPQILEIENCPEIQALFPSIGTATADVSVTHKVFNDKDFNFIYRYYFSEFAVPIIYGRAGEVGCYFNYPSSFSAKLLRCWDHLGYHDDITIFNGAGGVGYIDNGWDSMPSGRILKDVTKDLCTDFNNNFNNRVLPIYNAMGCTHHSNSYTAPDVSKYIGKIIHVAATGKYFIFDIKDNGVQVYEDKNATLKDNVVTSFNTTTHTGWSLQYDGQKVIAHATTSVNKTFQMRLNAASDITLDLLGTDDTDTSHDLGFQTQEVPYDIVCFPAFSTTVTKSDGSKGNVIGIAGINIARAISEQLGSTNLYDIQVLPYCPAREIIGTDGDIDIRLAGTHQVLEVKDNSSNVVTYAIFASSAFHKFDITTIGTSIYNDDEVTVSSELVVEDRKEQSNCDMYRLSCSNYASSFEFNLAKCTPINRPNLTKFNVDIDYRPTNPYIHIAPDFAFLYGGDYNDSRGLIFQGDFGLTTMLNSWTDYQVRNKNYQNIFNRQIQNMEVNRGIAREKENWNIASGAVGLAGIGIGSAIADGAGVLGGLGVVGATTGAIGGAFGLARRIREKQLNEQAYRENVSYTTDMFNMQMDNIKALPNTITHSASLTNNFKFYPVLEYYTCTEIEKISFRSKLKYNGMTVGRIDNINNYLSSDEERFVKGQMIRLDNLGEDSHIANDIYNEINNGVFFVPSSI